MSQGRLQYDDSIRRLRELGFLGQGEHPPIPDHVPQPEDEEPLGLSFFRTLVGEGADLSNLSIPRTIFGRSEISNASFRNTDLTESNLRWNDFIDADFTEAALVRADLRAAPAAELGRWALKQSWSNPLSSEVIHDRCPGVAWYRLNPR